MESESFLDRVYRLVAEGNHNDSSYLIFDFIDRMLSDSKFADLNDLLRDIDVCKLDSFSMRSFLSITKAAECYLLDRPELYNKVKARLIGLIGIDRTNKLLKSL